MELFLKTFKINTLEIGIIAEGKGDCAVLSNIIRGILGLEEEEIRFLRPDFNLDNTDKATYTNMSADEFSSWTLVKKDCEDRSKFNIFLDNPIAEERYIIVQIDTAECEEKGYDLPRFDKKDPNYCENLRNVVVQKINEWLENEWQEHIFYAICIEEMEAWIHTLYENKNTSIPLQAKESFQKYLSKQRKNNKKLNKALQKLQQKSEFDKANFLSKDFRKAKNIKKVKNRNESLKIFVTSLETLIE